MTVSKLDCSCRVMTHVECTEDWERTLRLEITPIQMCSGLGPMCGEDGKRGTHRDMELNVYAGSPTIE